jgi:hypothetical protein
MALLPLSIVTYLTYTITEISNFEHYAATNEPAVFIAAPVLKGGIVIGVVVLHWMT